MKKLLHALLSGFLFGVVLFLLGLFLYSVAAAAEWPDSFGPGEQWIARHTEQSVRHVAYLDHSVRRAHVEVVGLKEDLSLKFPGQDFNETGFLLVDVTWGPVGSRIVVEQSTDMRRWVVVRPWQRELVQWHWSHRTERLAFPPLVDPATDSFTLQFFRIRYAEQPQY